MKNSSRRLKKFTMSKIIVTGAAGFIGSNLVKRLLKENHQVIGLDNFSYGSRRNLEEIISHPSFEFHETDLLVKSSLQPFSGDAIVHLASQKIPRYSNAYRTLNENSNMLDIVINHCRNKKMKLVFASTSDIYGKNPNVPYAEDSDSLLGPTTVKRWSYALSKIHPGKQ